MRFIDDQEDLFIQRFIAQEKCFEHLQELLHPRARARAVQDDPGAVGLDGGEPSVVVAKVRDGFGGRLRYSISGCAAISVEVAEFISALGMTVYEGYGLTETSPVAAANTPSNRRVGSIGKEIP